MRQIGLKYFFISFLTFLGIKTEKDPFITPGLWRGVLMLGTEELPFNFEIIQQKKKLVMYVYNAEEKIQVTDITRSGDSVIVKMPVFDSEFHLKLEDTYTLRGYWWNKARKTQSKIPFFAKYGESFRFEPINEAYSGSSVEGRWEVHFSEEKPEESSPAVAEFKQFQNHVTGTFLTETGDYRYLEGIFSETEGLKLSCFDGAHAFLFTAKLDGKKFNLKGKFYSGMHWVENWSAKGNPGFQLRSPDSLTFLKPGYDKVAFSFPDLEGKKVSLSDKKFQGKVVIVQLMGSWCPNCMDETRLFQEWYQKYHSEGLEVVALCYERSDVFGDAVKAVSRMKENLGADYPFLIAGISNKTKASETLPMLNGISAFPTAIYIDRNGKVQKIHTGFSGPGTGQHYIEFVSETELLLKKMLK
ncbi:MAG: TlpA family protein disulfide reductase [Bacteroidia bacterium]|nr:TlpA family protein disulfide reductase [Bacteroidia bacterium]